MLRRDFLKISSYSSLLTLPACGLLRIDSMHPFLRSDRIDNAELETRVVSKAKLSWSSNGQVRVIYLKGDAYERGYQHGYLLRTEIQDNLGFLWRQATAKFHTAEIFAEAYERLRPFIPQDYIDEMHGLAHGSKMPLEIIHGVHALPCMTEWGGKKKLKAIVKQMMDGELSTSCSNFAVFDHASADQRMYVVRILDWGLHRISKLHQYPLLAVHDPEQGQAYVNIGWVGFLGAISGMNEQGITLGEMGYGDPPNETLRGKPMPFLLRDVLAHAQSLADARRIIQFSPGTNSFIYLMSDGKKGEAELYIRDRDRFLVFQAEEAIDDGKNKVTPIKNTLYGGHYLDRMYQCLSNMHGQISPQKIMQEVIPQMAMPSNFQNVVYDPSSLRFWVSYARSSEERAAEQPYTSFDFGRALSDFRAGRT